MSDQFLRHMPRRLPVFFLLDASVAMTGTFQVIMQEGCRMVSHELVRNSAAARHVYLGIITIGEEGGHIPWLLFVFFVPPTWTARGASVLQPALKLVVAEYAKLIASDAGRPGDYRPLIFCILGGQPHDKWEDVPKEIAHFAQNLHPLIVILVTRPELARSVRVLSNHIYTLQSFEAINIHHFFYWITQAIVKICEGYAHGLPPCTFLHCQQA